MSKNVFANGLEISAKKSSGKVIAAMPNVCMSPPSPPAGPIPIPYPVFASASDTSSGSKNTHIGGKPIMLKNKSEKKSSKGDAAATKSFGQGVIVGGLGGPVKFAAWSMDVKVEGENVCRFGDLTTGNHGSCNKDNEEVDAKDLCENGKPKPANGSGADKSAHWAKFGLG